MAKTVMITGAGSGFGKGASLALAERGHKVIATTETDVQAKELRAEAPQLTVEKLDITTNDVAKAAEWDIDVLINNAGAGQTGPMADVPIDRVRHLFEVNVFGTLAVTQSVLPKMIAKGKGRVIIVSSIAGVVVGPSFGPYSMTKHALEAMGKAMRAELAEQGIDVTLLNPGSVPHRLQRPHGRFHVGVVRRRRAQRAGHAALPDDARLRHQRADGSGRGRHTDGRVGRGRDHHREQLRPARDPRPDDRGGGELTMADLERSDRPWGSYAVLADEPDHKVKRLVVAPGKRLSYQRHEQRSEHWFFVQGVGALTLDGTRTEVRVGDAIDVPCGVAHRIENTGSEPLVLVEIQHGSYFGEDDIIRLEDDFGRV